MTTDKKQSLARQKLNDAWAIARAKDIANTLAIQARQREEMAGIQARTQAHVSTLPQEIERQKAERWLAMTTPKR